MLFMPHGGGIVEHSFQQELAPFLDVDVGFSFCLIIFV